jgi:hypothetical protein
MAAGEGLIASIDRVIEYFNARRMDLPDGFFDRKTQFVINGTPFEALLSTTPNDPLVMMLARGPAGFRFTAKALQHAMPDAKLDRGEVVDTGDRRTIACKVWLSGKLRGSGEAINAVVEIMLKLAQAGHVEIAKATIDPAILQSIKEARVRA